ncbi:lactonase family protein [Halomicrobium salinisoli]|uniref:lactonase family protein n=1 Tax=Halomicrobium salinisoli TaxID=2878391 RepID=UPI001CF01DBC|nr:lactonase family protein [Halomicrobium salinisoli]
MTRETYLAAIGTYSPADEDGVHTVEVDAETGAMRSLDSAVAGPDPTFVAPHPDGDVLYAAVREDDEGAIRAFEVDPESGALTAVDSSPSGALSPCHCSVDATGRHLFVAHYAGGAVSMLPIDEDGRPGSPTDVVEHAGSSVDPERQSAPHPHSISPGPDDRFVYVPDLGTDQVHVYEIDRDDGTLSPHDATDVREGAGPRHLAFGPDGDRAYLINELDSTITTFDRGPDGRLTRLSTTTTLPESFDGANKTAEVAVHPSGEFVFGSNRGHDSIATFAVDDDGLSPVEHTPTGGEWPRHFAIGPDGRFLFVENRDTDDVTAFRVDAETGTLSAADERLSVSEPVCLQWIPR